MSEAHERLPVWAAKLYRQTAKNAAVRGIPFSLSHADMLALCERSGGACELTGIRFEWTMLDGSLKRPWYPSIDRLHSSDGYSAANCRLVCVAVNLALHSFGEQVLHRIMHAMYGKSFTKPSRKRTRALPEHIEGFKTALGPRFGVKLRMSGKYVRSRRFESMEDAVACRNTMLEQRSNPHSDPHIAPAEDTVMH